MAKPEVLFVGGGPDWYLERFERDFRLHRMAEGDPALLDPAVARRVEALVGAAPVGRALIDALPRLRFIANSGAGYEKIDVAAARERGIVVTNTPGVTDGCVADMAFGLLLAAARHIVRGDRFARSGSWATDSYPLVPRVHGRRLGILGLGRIGLAIAKRAAGFDMPVAYCNRRRRSDVAYAYHETPEALARDCDFLVVACPAAPDTRHIVDAAVLQALGPKGIVVNIARGSIIDERALIDALQRNVIAGAGLDVLEEEPAVPAALAALDNVVLMPHRGGGTFETWEDACDLVKANLWSYFRGEPPLTPIP